MIQWIVHGLIPVGFSIFAGREKSGKSLMTFGSIAMAVALGVPVFGLYPTSPGIVLYFALEEGLPTIVSRMERLFSTTDEVWYPPENLRLFTEADIGSFTDDAIDRLEALILANPGVVMVVIDTMRLMAPVRKSGAASADYDHEYRFGSLLQKLALKYNIAIIALHHTTKAPHADIFDSIGGTAWTKAAEMMAVLERDGLGAKLHIRGRSLPTSVNRMSQDPDSLRWTMQADQGVSEQLERNKKQSAIGKVSVDDVFIDQQTLRYSDVKMRFSGLDLSEASANRWLAQQIKDGTIEKCPDGLGYVRLQAATNNHLQPFLWEMPDGGSTAVVLPPSAAPMEIAGGGSADEWDNEIEVTPESTEIL
ncbi:MAG: AAA family ATPase [Ignavibacteria bacterium]|nr:AAA family ATPase [Ignavibacteria bacterium]